MKRLLLLLAATTLCTWGARAQSTNAAAFRPVNPPAMQPLADHDSPAYRTARLLQHGVNLGDYLEAGNNWGVKVSTAEFAAMAGEGFDHVRVPVAWHRHAGPAPDYTLSPEIFASVDFAVTNILANKMAAMINIHHFNELDQNPAAATAEFLALWRQIAAHYQAYPASLVFELDNEPHDQATTALMNPIYARVIAEIRLSNPRRTLVVEPGGWGGIDELNRLVLPPDDNVIVSVHCYDPFPFTHQGAGWAGDDVKQTGIIFPGPPAQPLVPDASLNPKPGVLDWIQKYNTLPSNENPSSPLAFTGKLKFIRAWSDYYGRPVHLGEFGAYVKVDAASRLNFYTAFRQAAEKEHIGWCLWDWSANFRYWDQASARPVPGMHTALFGN